MRVFRGKVTTILKTRGANSASRTRPMRVRIRCRIVSRSPSRANRNAIRIERPIRVGMLRLGMTRS
jgi:hypothetical protein